MKLKTIDEVCGNPPGTFLKSVEENAKNERDMENKRRERIKNRIPPPPVRIIQSTRHYMIELNDWEKKYNVKFSDYLKKDKHES